MVQWRRNYWRIYEGGDGMASVETVDLLSLRVVKPTCSSKYLQSDFLQFSPKRQHLPPAAKPNRLQAALPPACLNYFPYTTHGKIISSDRLRELLIADQLTATLTRATYGAKRENGDEREHPEERKERRVMECREEREGETGEEEGRRRGGGRQKKKKN